MVPIGEFRFGLCHGHQVLPWGDADALAGLARALDVDVLVTGHSLEFSAQRHSGGRVLVNPGSATGAGAGGCGCGGGGGGAAGAAATRPSFVLMDVDGARLVAYIYQARVGGERERELELDRLTRLPPVVLLFPPPSFAAGGRRRQGGEDGLVKEAFGGAALACLAGLAVALPPPAVQLAPAADVCPTWRLRPAAPAARDRVIACLR